MVNSSLIDILTGRNTSHKDFGNFQKLLTLICLFFSLVSIVLYILVLWLNGWVFVLELSGCGFESSCGKHRIQFSYYGYCISSLSDEDFRINNLVGLISRKTVIYYRFISTANLLIIPGTLFYLNCLSPIVLFIILSWSRRFPSLKTSSIVALFLPVV